jgi:hypothetical protein
MKTKVVFLFFSEKTRTKVDRTKTAGEGQLRQKHYEIVCI